eukprot:2845384-Karenia_brevis.AAC.1
MPQGVMPLQETMELAGIGEERGCPPPPGPHGQPRANRPKREWRIKLKPADWQEGSKGLRSLADML